MSDPKSEKDQTRDQPQATATPAGSTAPTPPHAPNPEPKSAAEGSAPVADPAGLVQATAPTEQPATGGSRVPSGREPTATQEGAASAEAPLANVEAMRARMDVAGTAETDSWGREAWTDPDVENHPAVRAIRERFPETIVQIVRFRDETTIHLRAEDLREVCAHLRQHPRVGLDALTDVTAVDMLRLRENPRFDIVVHLYSLRHRTRLRLKAGVDDGQPVPSLVPLWNGANWLEREVYDMFGIIFDGHPNLRRILLPDDWDEGFPLRKDYPLRGWREFPVYNTERTVARQRTRWTGRDT